MKTTILTGILGLVAIAFAACNQPAGNTATNHNGTTMNGNMNHNAMTSNANHDMSTMHHGGMESSPNAAGQPYDLQFIDTMTAHHKGAIEMAEMVLEKSSRNELKKFAQKIIDDQTKEIGQMKDWRDKWYAGKPAAINMEMPGMGDSMKMLMDDKMEKMEAASSQDFDIHFLDMMTPHHGGAVTMAKEALSKAEHTEIKTLASQIIKAQEAEIKMMADWKAAWSK